MAVDVDLLNSNSINNIDTNFERVQTALQDAVSRSGTTPNELNVDLDMNSNDILNVGTIQVEDITIDGEDATGILQRALDAVEDAEGFAIDSENNAIDSAASALEAANYAAGLNLPPIQEGDSGKQLYVNSEEDGYELLPPSATPIVSTRTALSALDTSINTRASLTEGVPATYGRFGIFNFVVDDLSSMVTADPLQGIYVAPDSDPTGASGAWVRERASPNEFNVCWWGAVGIASSDYSELNRQAFQAFHDFLLNLSPGAYELEVPFGDYYISDELNFTRASSTGIDLRIKLNGWLYSDFYGATKYLIKSRHPTLSSRCAPLSITGQGQLRTVSRSGGVNPILLGVAGWGNSQIDIQFGPSNNTVLSGGSMQNVKSNKMICYFSGKSWQYKDTDGLLFDITGTGTDRTITCTNGTPFTSGSGGTPNDVGMRFLTFHTNGDRLKWEILTVSSTSVITARIKSGARNTTGASGFFEHLRVSVTNGSNLVFCNGNLAPFAAEDIGRVVYIPRGRLGIDNQRSVLRGRIGSIESPNAFRLVDESGNALNATLSGTNQSLLTPVFDFYYESAGPAAINALSTDNKFGTIQISDYNGLALGLWGLQQFTIETLKFEGLIGGVTSARGSSMQICGDNVTGRIFGGDFSTHGGMNRDRIYLSNLNSAFMIIGSDFRNFIGEEYFVYLDELLNAGGLVVVDGLSVRNNIASYDDLFSDQNTPPRLLRQGAFTAPNLAATGQLGYGHATSRGGITLNPSGSSGQIGNNTLAITSSGTLVFRDGTGTLRSVNLTAI